MHAWIAPPTCDEILFPLENLNTDIVRRRYLDGRYGAILKTYYFGKNSFLTTDGNSTDGVNSFQPITDNGE